MTEEKKEPWLNWLALTTVVLAVCATLATFKGGGYSTRSVMSQNQASDTWAHYQAKSIKGSLYELQRDKVRLESKVLADRDKGAAAALEDYRKAEEAYGEKVAKYEKEKADIQKEAQRLEAVRDDAKLHSQAFGYAVIFLQIAILLSSIAALLKKKPIWVAGLAVGAVGLVSFANGFFLFVK